MNQTQNTVNKLEDKLEQQKENFEILKQTLENILRNPLNMNDFADYENEEEFFQNHHERGEMMYARRKFDSNSKRID